MHFKRGTLLFSKQEDPRENRAFLKKMSSALDGIQGKKGGGVKSLLLVWREGNGGRMDTKRVRRKTWKKTWRAKELIRR